MPISRVALVCVVLSVVLAIVCSPRVFYGNGSGSAVFSLDDFFFWGQWAAFVFAMAAMLMSWPAWIGDGRMISASALWVPLLSLLMSGYLLLTGVPHRANRARWATGEMGVAAFVRGMRQSGRERTKLHPVAITAAPFTGEWRAADSIVYAFEQNNVYGRNAAGTRSALGSTDCAGVFSVRYYQRDREILQDLGFTWSAHANAVYDATRADAMIPVAEVTCGTERLLFIRATPNELWRWTSAMTIDDFKDAGFLMRRVGAPI